MTTPAETAAHQWVVVNRSGQVLSAHPDQSTAAAECLRLREAGSAEDPRMRDRRTRREYIPYRPDYGHA